jgi:catechol 2,3-dioxygenase-like lactoylglutathione lyase family enzyme
MAGDTNEPVLQAFISGTRLTGYGREERDVQVRGSWLSGSRRLLPGILMAGMLALVVPGQARAAPNPPDSSSIRTDDFDAALNWYQDKLSFRLLSTRSLVQGRVAVMERSGFLLEISEADHILSEGSDPEATGNLASPAPVVSLLVPDVDAEVAQLQAKGVDVLQQPEDTLEGDYRVAEIRDNTRHRIELREPLGDPGGFHANGR